MRAIHRMVLKCLPTVAGLAICSSVAQSQTKIWHTYPQPPHAVASDPMSRINPAIEIPQDVDKYLWRITNKVGGKVVSTGGVRVFGFDGLDHGGRIGELQSGTTVRLLAHRQINRVIFYEVPFERQGSRQVGSENVGWVEGIYLEVAGLNPNPGAADSAPTTTASVSSPSKIAPKAAKATASNSGAKTSAKATPAK